MSRLRLPFLLFAIALLASLLSVVLAYPLLPPRVASHFNAAGQPDAWSSRGELLLVMGAVGVVMPVVLIAIFYGVRHFPPSLINLPQREYWLAAPRRKETWTTLLELGLWFGLLQTLFFLAIHWLVVSANRHVPVRLTMAVWVVMGGYLALVAAWLWMMWRRFRVPA